MRTRLINLRFHKWVMMNQVTRRLQKISEEVRDEYLVFFPKTPRFAFPEENNGSSREILKLEYPAQFSRLGLTSVPREVAATHELQTITLDYRRECQHDDIVDSLTCPEPDEDADVMKLKNQGNTNGHASVAKDGGDVHQFLHLLRLSGEGLEINRGRTKWRSHKESELLSIVLYSAPSPTVPFCGSLLSCKWLA